MSKTNTNTNIFGLIKKANTNIFRVKKKWANTNRNIRTDICEYKYEYEYSSRTGV